MLTFTVVLACLTLAAQSARDDRRDEVRLKTGETLRGRVVQRFDPRALVLDEGGRQREVPLGHVDRVRTVADAVADLLDLRLPGLTVAANWTLAEMAASQGLGALARLQAYHVLLADPDHAGAHELLGHQGSPGKWRWRLDGEFVPAATFLRRAQRERFTLRSEHFTLQSRAGLAAAVDALFDLERTYAVFWRELGKDLRPRSLFAPIAVHVHPSLADMPKLSTTMSEPYCDPSVAGGGEVHTFQELTMERPARLAAIAIEALLYRTLLDPRAGVPQRIDDRYAPWIEVGLGRFYESRGTGKAGYLAFTAPKLDTFLAAQVLRYRPYGLEDLIHVGFPAFHEDPVAAPFHVAHAAMLVTYLMGDGHTAGSPPVALRPRFLAYVRACYHEGRGNSSSVLDDALGKEIGRIESLEKPWIAWLAGASGQPALRAVHHLPRRSLRARVLGPLGR